MKKELPKEHEGFWPMATGQVIMRTLLTFLSTVMTLCTLESSIGDAFALDLWAVEPGNNVSSASLTPGVRQDSVNSPPGLANVAATASDGYFLNSDFEQELDVGWTVIVGGVAGIAERS